jgi:GNAT superfamily N-acetyltransferase
MDSVPKPSAGPPVFATAIYHARWTPASPVIDRVISRVTIPGVQELQSCGPNEDSVCLREYRPCDLNSVKGLIHGTIDDCYPPVYPAEAVLFFKAYHSDEAIAARTSQGHTVVLEQHGRIVGTGTLGNDHVSAVFVERSFQGKGLGRRLMRHLEAKARSVGVSCVTLDASLPSKRFYDSLGYFVIDEAVLPVANGKSLRFYRMRKPLDSNPKG